MKVCSRCFIILLASSLAACSGMWGGQSGARSGVSSSLVDYLYPKGEVPPEFDATVPRLNLPLRVGLAFVPSNGQFAPWFSEATKTELLDQVSLAFQDRQYVDHIEVIPDTYLRASDGFDGLQQVARLYGVDVMALVSYDQVAATDDTKASLLYWTIVGAYVIEGTQNEVQTFVDTAVFDIASRQLLFRAPGTDKRESKTTLVESGENLRRSRELGFTDAMANMTVNLTSELESFEKELANNSGKAEVSWKDGQGGAGAASLFWLALLTACLVRRRKEPEANCQYGIGSCKITPSSRAAH